MSVCVCVYVYIAHQKKLCFVPKGILHVINLTLAMFSRLVFPLSVRQTFGPFLFSPISSITPVLCRSKFFHIWSVSDRFKLIVPSSFGLSCRLLNLFNMKKDICFFSNESFMRSKGRRKLLVKF